MWFELIVCLHITGFASLPRPKRTPAQPAQRRKEVNSVLQGYLKSLGSMARSIELEKETVKQEHVQWTSMDDATKEEVVNDHFIPQDIRLQYSFDFPIDRSVSRASHCSVPPSWPGRPQSAHSMHDGMFPDGSSSQPNDWEGDQYRQRRQLPGSSQEDLSYRDHRVNTLVSGSALCMFVNCVRLAGKFLTFVRIMSGISLHLDSDEWLLPLALALCMALQMSPGD